MGVLKNPYPRSTTSENDFFGHPSRIDHVPINLTQFCYIPGVHNRNLRYLAIENVFREIVVIEKQTAHPQRATFKWHSKMQSK